MSRRPEGPPWCCGVGGPRSRRGDAPSELSPVQLLGDGSGSLPVSGPSLWTGDLGPGAAAAQRVLSEPGRRAPEGPRRAAALLRPLEAAEGGRGQGSDSSGLGWNLRICISSKVPGDAQESGPHCNSIVPNGENKIPSFPSLQKCRHREGVRYGKLQDC